MRPWKVLDHFLTVKCVRSFITFKQCDNILLTREQDQSTQVSHSIKQISRPFCTLVQEVWRQCIPYGRRPFYVALAAVEWRSDARWLTCEDWFCLRVLILNLRCRKSSFLFITVLSKESRGLERWSQHSLILQFINIVGKYLKIPVGSDRNLLVLCF